MCVGNHVNNGTYLYDSNKEIMHLSIGGESSAADVISMDAKEFTLREGKILVRFTKLSNETEGKSPENIAGKKLAIGVAKERNINFKSNSSCEIQLDRDEVAYEEVRISETPVCLYKKIDEKTAKLSYS